MKTKSPSANKARGNGSSPRARETQGIEQGPGSEACPREQMIAVAAYFRAQQRGFTPDKELSDWLEAEAEVENLLGRSH